MAYTAKLRLDDGDVETQIKALAVELNDLLDTAMEDPIEVNSYLDRNDRVGALNVCIGAVVTLGGTYPVYVHVDDDDWAVVLRAVADEVDAL